MLSRKKMMSSKTSICKEWRAVFKRTNGIYLSKTSKSLRFTHSYDWTYGRSNQSWTFILHKQVNACYEKSEDILHGCLQVFLFEGVDRCALQLLLDEGVNPCLTCKKKKAPKERTTNSHVLTVSSYLSKRLCPSKFWINFGGTSTYTSAIISYWMFHITLTSS